MVPVPIIMQECPMSYNRGMSKYAHGSHAFNFLLECLVLYIGSVRRRYVPPALIKSGAERIAWNERNNKTFIADTKVQPSFCMYG